MPIIDVELVCETEAEFSAVSATDLANAIGDALQSPAGRTWVRLRFLGSASYAENHVAVSKAELPAFVTVLHARPPVESALASEVSALTDAVAQVVGRPVERVHVQYAPAAAGRQAFGGQLVQ